MAEVHAVVGYLPDAAAKSLALGKGSNEAVEVRLDVDSGAYVRIQAKDVAGVLLGASKKGQTGVQVFLNDKAQVEQISRGLAADFRLWPIKDPILWPTRPPIVVIYAPPIRIRDLIAAQRADLLKK
jgi:hypothetical protein